MAGFKANVSSLRNSGVLSAQPLWRKMPVVEQAKILKEPVLNKPQLHIVGAEGKKGIQLHVRSLVTKSSRKQLLNVQPLAPSALKNSAPKQLCTARLVPQQPCV